MTSRAGLIRPRNLALTSSLLSLVCALAQACGPSLIALEDSSVIDLRANLVHVEGGAASQGICPEETPQLRISAVTEEDGTFDTWALGPDRVEPSADAKLGSLDFELFTISSDQLDVDGHNGEVRAHRDDLRASREGYTLEIALVQDPSLSRTFTFDASFGCIESVPLDHARVTLALGYTHLGESVEHLFVRVEDGDMEPSYILFNTNSGAVLTFNTLAESTVVTFLIPQEFPSILDHVRMQGAQDSQPEVELRRAPLNEIFPDEIEAGYLAGVSSQD